MSASYGRKEQFRRCRLTKTRNQDQEKITYKELARSGRGETTGRAQHRPPDARARRYATMFEKKAPKEWLRTKIVCTSKRPMQPGPAATTHVPYCAWRQRFSHPGWCVAVGPITQPVEKLKGLYEAGMRCARMNFSHGSHEVCGARSRWFAPVVPPNAPKRQAQRSWRWYRTSKPCDLG